MSSVFVPHTQARSPNPTDQSGEAPEAQAPRQSEGVSQKGLPCLWVARQREMLCSPLTLSIHPPPPPCPVSPRGTGRPAATGNSRTPCIPCLAMQRLPAPWVPPFTARHSAPEEIGVVWCPEGSGGADIAAGEG